MKPLLSRKVQRGNGDVEAKTLREWLPAESQLTVDGLNAFAARQRERMAQAQMKRPTRPTNAIAELALVIYGIGRKQ